MTLLRRIDERLSQPVPEVEAAELLAEKACYLARIGRFDEARELVRTLRGRFGTGSSLVVSVWVMLAEGVTSYFEHVGRDAYDRIFRAHALSVAGKADYLVGISAAWLAHIELFRCDFARMSGHALQALSAPVTFSAHAAIRVAIVLGDAWLVAGQRGNAQAWYEAARHRAVDAGDSAAIGAVIYNRAALGLALLRRHKLTGETIERYDDALRLATYEMDSALALQLATHNQSLTHLLEVCRGQALMLRGRYDGAIELFESVRGRRLQMDEASDKSPLKMDLALCYVLQHRLDKAADVVAEVDPAEIGRLGNDDQLIVYDRLSELARNGISVAGFEPIADKFSDALQAFTIEQTALKAALSDPRFDPPPPPIGSGISTQ